MLAYKNGAFLDSDDGRPIRILSEYLEPLAAFRRMRVCDTIVFFGSARLKEDGPLGRYYAEARELARLVTLWSKSLPQGAHRFVVCSGGGGGIMEAANRGASDAGGMTIGLNIGLPHEQRPNPYITRELLFEFHYFFMRKLWFAHLARALVAFPGGFGTLDELMEILTLAQTGKLRAEDDHHSLRLELLARDRRLRRARAARDDQRRGSEVVPVRRRPGGGAADPAGRARHRGDRGDAVVRFVLHA